MRYLALALVFLLPGGVALAQEVQPEVVRKLFKLQHVNVNDVSFLLNGWIRAFPSKEIETIIVQGTPEQVAEAEQVIREVDRPGAKGLSDSSVELDAYFVSAGGQPTGGSIPPLVAPAISELQRRFAHAHYGLLDSALLRVSIGSQAHVQGQFAGTEELPTQYRLEAQPTRIAAATEGSRTIRLKGLQANWDIPYRDSYVDKESGRTIPRMSYRELRIETDVSIPEGKLVVVGKAGSPTSAEAIFLILRARLVE